MRRNMLLARRQGEMTQCAMRFALLVALVVPSLLPAQQAPRRPRLSGDADTNDAVAYFQAGLDRLTQNPRDAANAFYWAERLDPASPQILYARHVALLMSDGNRLVSYMQRDQNTFFLDEIRQIDMLYYRALMTDPFLQPSLEEPLLIAFFRRLRTQETWLSGPGGQTRPSDFALLRAMDTTFAEYNPLWRGILAMSRGNAREALQYYARALDRRRARTDLINLHRSIAFYHLRELDSARTAMDSAIAAMRTADTTRVRPIYESKAQWEYALGRLHEEQGNLTAARAAYQRAIVEELSYFPAHLRMGHLSLREGDTAAALLEFERAVQVKENDYIARAYLGAVLGRLGRNRDAAAHLRRATELEPWAAPSWLLLGREHDRAADTTAALAAYDRYIALSRRADPPRAAVRARAGELRAARSRP